MKCPVCGSPEFDYLEATQRCVCMRCRKLGTIEEFNETTMNDTIVLVWAPPEHMKTAQQMVAQLNASVTRTERGWGAHFVGGDKCYFRRNTLIEVGDRRVVVSTVGNYHGTWEPLGGSVRPGDGRIYETMAFEAIQEGIYWEADVCKPFAFDGVQALPKGSNDLEANDMHENAVDAIERLLVAS